MILSPMPHINHLFSAFPRVANISFHRCIQTIVSPDYEGLAHSISDSPENGRDHGEGKESRERSPRFHDVGVLSVGGLRGC